MYNLHATVFAIFAGAKELCKYNIKSLNQEKGFTQRGKEILYDNNVICFVLLLKILSVN
jgi:hypothetical protein